MKYQICVTIPNGETGKQVTLRSSLFSEKPEKELVELKWAQPSWNWWIQCYFDEKDEDYPNFKLGEGRR